MTDMHRFSDTEIKEIHSLLTLALAEDRVEADATSLAIFDEGATMQANIVAREPMVMAGVEVLPMLANECLSIDFDLRDGDAVQTGAIIATIKGANRELLALERTALNLLQRLCGVATLTKKYVDAVAGTNAIILDTRKTMPGWRVLDKYAVRCGGGQNHRMHLADAMMIKDNHIAACGGLIEAINKAVAHQPNLPLIVECDTLEQVQQAYTCSIDRILLDNMPPQTLAQAVQIVGGKLPLEASGGITLDSIKAVAQTGVDYISVGKITHGAVMVDIGMDTVIPA